MLKKVHNIREIVANLPLLKPLYLTCLKLIPIHKRYYLNRMFRTPFSKLENDKKIIFIHIPKAAGNALIKTLFDQSATGHDPILRYKENNSVKYNDFYKFTVVRNPWDRIVSAFHYLKQGGIGFFDKDFSNEYLDDVPDFSTFVKRLESDNVFRNNILTWIHFVPQIDFLSDEYGDVALNKIIKLENINDEIPSLCKDLGISNRDMISDNSCKRKPYQYYYDDELAAIVGTIYKQDIERLGYAFE